MDPGHGKSPVFLFVPTSWGNLLCNQFERYLPEEYQVLVELVSLLPGNPGSAVSPFLSLVVNLNVCTEAHRDAKDKDLCLVLAIGDFKGGALCLLEPGLVLELMSGDIAVFRSAEVTHFNLHYAGKRASLVLSSDREFQKWQASYNQWKGHAHMNTFNE
jgi:hypothetical protein